MNMNMNMIQKKDEMDSLKTDDDSSNNNFDMKFQEALSYLDEVKMSFKEQPSVYNEFLDILCSQDLDIPSVIRRVSYLFRDQQTKFVLGFNTFLPNDYKIQLNDEEDDDDIYDEEEDDDCNQEEEGDDEVLADDIVATTVALSGMKHLNDCYDHENSTSSRKLKYDDYSSSTDDGLYQMYGDDDDGDHALLLLQQPPNKVRRRSQQQQQQRRSRSSKSSPRSSMNILASTASVAASGATNVNDQQIQILKAIDSGMFDRLAALSSSGPEELVGDDSQETTTMMNDDENSQHHQTTASASAVKPEPLSNGAAQVSEDSNMSSPSTKSPSPKMKTPTTTKKRKQKDVSKSTTTNTTKKQSRTSIGSSGGGGGSGSRGRGKPRRVIPQNKVFIDGEPRDVDVVSGRGGRSNNHPGNQTHWLVMLKHRSTYNSCGNDDAAKNRIAQDVVDFIEKRQGGRYVQRCKETNCWFVLPNKVALEKVKQGLRDKHVPDWVGKHNSDPNKIPIPQAQPQPQPPKILPPSSHHHQQQQQHHHHHQQMNHQHQHRNLVRGGMNYYQGY